VEVQTAGDSQEDVDTNGPQAVVLTANSPQERKGLAVLVAIVIASFQGPPEAENADQ
jgi:hypothetical protein